MAAYTRKQYSGAARNTTTTTLLTNVGTTVDIAATTGWPAIAGIPFYIVINPSSIFEEKCLATISGSTLTLVRAQDDTTASEHPIGSIIYPVFTANDADEANELVSKLTTAGDLLTTDGTNLLRLGVGPNGYFLKASSSASAGIEWASIPTINSLDDIGDVTITAAADGEFLAYDSSASVWVNQSVQFITVSDNPPTIGVEEGDLWYNSLELELYTYYSGAWVQTTDSSSGVQEIYELVDVLIDDPVSGESLVYNGTEWENGPAGSALTLENARVISLSGDVSGSVSFDGSQNITIPTTVQINSITLGTDTTGNYMSDLTQGTGVTITHTPSEGSNATIAIGQAVGTSSSVTFANVTADLVGDVTGNADTATTLENARTISLGGDVSGSVSFNGSSDVSISTTIQPNSVALGTDTTGNYVNDLTGGTGVTITHTPGEGSNPTVAIGQSVATSASVTFAHVAADVTGNVTGNITGSSGSTTGNAATATALQNARTISLSGDVSGSVSFDGTSNVSISTTVQPDSVALGTDTTGNYVNDLTAGTGVTITHTPGEGSSPTVAIGQSVATSASVTFAQVDATGDLVVGGNLTVNGTTTTLNTETLEIEDNIVVFNSNVTGSPTTNAGIEVERGTSDNVSMRWNESTDRWDFTNDGTTYQNVLLLSDIGQDSLNDTVITSPLNHQSLTYNGTSWVNEYAPLVTYARNAEANALSVGEVVYLFGATGDRASVKRASNTSDTTSSKTVGVVSVGGAAGADVTVTTVGYVGGVSLGSYTAGDVLWLDSTAGTFTTTKPTAPAHTVFVGVVARANNGNGIMYVKCQNGYELDELHDVKISSPLDGQFLRYNSASVVWVNDTINLGTDTTGNYMANVSAGNGISISHTQGEGSTATISTTGVQTLAAKAGNYTLEAGDATETVIIMDSGSANDLTIPPDSSVAFAVGTSISVVQRGIGKTRILAGSGVSLLATPGIFLRARYASCLLIKTENANEWFVIGDLATS